MKAYALVVIAIAACGRPPAAAPAERPAATPSPPAPSFSPVVEGAAGPAVLHATAIPLPGATAPVTIDYIAYEPAHARVWIPVGDTGSVDVLDTARGTFTRVDGFRTAEREAHGKKRMLGPSAVAIGDGFAYIGDRASQEVCPVDTATLQLGKCLALGSPTDGVAYVAPTKEVWVTTPRDQSLVVLDASTPATLRRKGENSEIRLDGAPEGYAVDEVRRLFLTNLEDKNETLAIDLATHKVADRWPSGCGANGPRGIAAESAHGWVLVACTDGVNVFGARNGPDRPLLGKVDAGPGVDNIDWVEGRRLLFAAAGRASTLVVAYIDDEGHPRVVGTGASGEGARNAVAGANGAAYLPDAARAQVLLFAGP